MIVVKLRSRSTQDSIDFAEMLRDVYSDEVESAEVIEAPAEFEYEYQMVMTRHGKRRMRYGGRAYPRVGAADEAQVRQFVESERAEGHKSWAERRLVGPWKKFL